MRFSTHDPLAESRKGLLLLSVGLVAAVGLGLCAVRVAETGLAHRACAAAVAGALIAACFALAGALALRDAAAMRREGLLFAGRRREAVEPRAKFRRRREGERPPDPGSAVPARRLTAVTAMFAGLILPLLAGAWGLAGQGPGGGILAALQTMLAVWLGVNVYALWKGSAWVPAVGVFLVGLIFSASQLVFGTQGKAWAGAATAHFAVGLATLFSLRPWLRHLDEKSWRDPLATADKAAVLQALRARATPRGDVS